MGPAKAVSKLEFLPPRVPLNTAGGIVRAAGGKVKGVFEPVFIHIVIRSYAIAAKTL